MDLLSNKTLIAVLLVLQVVVLVNVQGVVTTAKPETDEEPNCVITPHTLELGQEIKSYMLSSKLIEYSFTFLSNRSNAVVKKDLIAKVESVEYYKPAYWQRVFTRHGEALLSLPFQYNVLSLSLLSHGVLKLSVVLKDNPAGCYANLSSQGRVTKVRELVLFDFDIPEEADDRWVEKGNYACSKVMKNNHGVANFVPHCCTVNQTTKEWHCEDYIPGKWFSLLFNSIPWMDVLAFLFLPAFLLGIITRRSYRTTNYIIKLEEPHETIIKKDINIVELRDIEPKSGGITSEIKPILSKSSRKKTSKEASSNRRKCVDHVRRLPWNKPTTVVLPLMHILADHKKLMSEGDVNIGVMSFLWKNFFLCRLRFSFPFMNCCKQSILGSWKNSIFCCPIPQKYAFVAKMRLLNRRLRICLSWGKVFTSLALLGVVVILIPLPYYIQLLIYKIYSAEEMGDRKLAAEETAISINPPPYLPYYFFIPFIPLHIAAISLYFVSSFILLILWSVDNFDFVEYLVDIIRDFKHLERTETFRMLSLHIVTPFEKFGLLGCVVGPFMWLVTIPFGILTIIYYCIPTVYLIGRLIFLRKPGFVEKLMWHKKTHSTRYTSTRRDEERMKRHSKKRRTLGVPDSDTESEDDEELDNLEKMLLLNHISPRNDETVAIRPLEKDGTLNRKTHVGYNDCQKVCIGTLLTMWMVGLLIIYADFVGFTLEVLTLTFMGAIANAGSVGQYFFFVFFIVTYTKTVLNKVNEKYKMLSSELFSHIKSKLDSSLGETVIMRGDEQTNFAFKFFSKKELRELNENRQLSKISDVEDSFCDIYKDKFEMKKSKLHLKVHSVILFLDKYDNPRIPIKLFDRVCKIRCPGCPGPIYKSLIIAMKELGYLILFLFFVMVVVMAFSSTYEVTSTNQLLLTVIGGFAPFVIRFVLKPKVLHVNFSTYSFKGKVHEIVSNFSQSWPVFDIEFDFPEESETDTEKPNETEKQSDEHTPPENAEVLSTITLETPVSEENIVVTTTEGVEHTHTHSAASGTCKPFLQVPPVGEKVNLYKLDTEAKDADLVFHMKSAEDGEEDLDLLIV